MSATVGASSSPDKLIPKQIKAKWLDVNSDYIKHPVQIKSTRGAVRGLPEKILLSEKHTKSFIAKIYFHQCLAWEFN